MSLSVKILNSDNSVDESFTYWNNEKIEKNKLFYKLIDDFDKIKNDNKQNLLSNELNRVIKNNSLELNGKNILSIASGVCYVEARSFKNINFKKLTCVDFSKHRITKLAPHVFRNFEIERKNIELISGDFNIYANHYTEDNFDFIIMCQAFHHFSNPNHILGKINKLLNPGGCIIMIGEPNHKKTYFFKQIIKNLIKYIINYKKFRLSSSFSEILYGAVSVDKIKGDHHWPLKIYKNFFRKNKFTLIETSILKKNNTRTFYLKQNV